MREPGGDLRHRAGGAVQRSLRVGKPIASGHIGGQVRHRRREGHLLLGDGAREGVGLFRQFPVIWVQMPMHGEQPQP